MSFAYTLANLTNSLPELTCKLNSELQTKEPHFTRTNDRISTTDWQSVPQTADVYSNVEPMQDTGEECVATFPVASYLTPLLFLAIRPLTNGVDIMAQLSLERVKKRIEDLGKFQMNQTITLQDAEIMRLRSRLRAFQARIVETKSLWEGRINQVETKLEMTRHRLHAVVQKGQKMVNKLKREHASRLESIRELHAEDVRTLNRDADRLVRTSELSAMLDEDETESLATQRIQSMSLEISRLNNEAAELDPRTKYVQRKISRKEIKAKAFQRRIADLSDAIREEQEYRAESRRRHEEQMRAIQAQMETFDRKMAQTRSEFDESVVELTEAQPEEPEELEILRRRIKKARKLTCTIQSQIEQMHGEYKAVKQQLKDKRDVLRYKRNRSTRVPSQSDAIRTEIEEEERVMAQIREELDARDPVLAKLHEKNAQLQRRVSEADYIVHGRSGGHQRLYKHDLVYRHD